MARRLSSREYTLVGLLAVVAIIVLYMRGGGPGSAGRAGDDSIAELIVEEPPLVHMDRLTASVEGYDPQGRNLFKYYTPPVTPRIAPPPKPPVRPPFQRPAPKPRDQRPATARAPVATPPPVSFTYLGFLGPKNAKIAVFEDKEDLLLARAGDVVQDQFRIVQFGFETVTIGYTDERFQDRTTELKQKKRR